MLVFLFYFRVLTDGMNWGRVASLMYMAYLIIIKVAKKKAADNLPRFLRLIVSHVVRYIRENLASWIASQGGWVSKRLVSKVGGIVTSH